MRRLLFTVPLVLAAVGRLVAGDTEALKDALQDDLVSKRWIYEDLDAGYAAARASGKPLLVSFRCVP